MQSNYYVPNLLVGAAVRIFERGMAMLEALLPFTTPAGGCSTGSCHLEAASPRNPGTARYHRSIGTSASPEADAYRDAHVRCTDTDRIGQTRIDASMLLSCAVEKFSIGRVRKAPSQFREILDNLFKCPWVLLY